MVVPIAAVVGIDTPFTTLAEAEHALLVLGQQVELPAEATVCTHEIRVGQPHYAFSIAIDASWAAEVFNSAGDHFAGYPVALQHDATDFDSLSPGLGGAVGQTFARNGGRAVIFPGRAELVGTLPVHHLLASSAIDDLQVLGGGTCQPGDLVHTRDFIRPLWRNGRLVLPVMPAGANALAPFEVPNPTPCCAVHSGPA
jgi:hypothetical protein